jgi:transcriptional regulator with XRE-family HTH domain
MDLISAISQVLRQIRLEHKLSTRDIQDQYDISKVTLSKWENNRALISISSLENYIRKVYDIQVSEVILRAEALVKDPELAESHLEKYKPLRPGPTKKD